MKKFLAIILCLILVVTCAFVLVGCDYNPKIEIQNFSVEGDIKVGIISDSQLPPKQSEDNAIFKEHLINSLSGLKANALMLLFLREILGMRQVTMLMIVI